MKCPHCSERVGLFSNELKEIGKTGVCPNCGRKVKMGVIHSRFAAGFIPVALLAIVFGVSGPIAAGIAGGVGAAVGLGLKSGEA
jgi:DNA-directed RNA polymerase subunit RPC12/RpoP